MHDAAGLASDLGFLSAANRQLLPLLEELAELSSRKPGRRAAGVRRS